MAGVSCRSRNQDSAVWVSVSLDAVKKKALPCRNGVVWALSLPNCPYESILYPVCSPPSTPHLFRALACLCGYQRVGTSLLAVCPVPQAVACLCGCDYAVDGGKGVGVKSAMEVVQALTKGRQVRAGSVLAVVCISAGATGGPLEVARARSLCTSGGCVLARVLLTPHGGDDSC